MLSTGLGNPLVSRKHGRSAGDRATETRFLPPSKFTASDPGSRKPLASHSGLDRDPEFCGSLEIKRLEEPGAV